MSRFISLEEFSTSQKRSKPSTEPITFWSTIMSFRPANKNSNDNTRISVEEKSDKAMFYLCVSLYAMSWLGLVLMALYVSKDCFSYCLLPSQDTAATRRNNYATFIGQDSVSSGTWHNLWGNVMVQFAK